MELVFMQHLIFIILSNTYALFFLLPLTIFVCLCLFVSYLCQPPSLPSSLCLILFNCLLVSLTVS